jgi:hypothetical protein
LLMASQIPRNRRRIQVQEKDLVPGSAGEEEVAFIDMGCW